MTSRMFILAGEASGDVLAAQLMQAVEQIKGPVDWTGMGGPEMTAAGLTSAEEMSQLSVIGLGEALTALPRLSRLADRLIDRVLDTRPDIVFTVDSKAFSVRFARRLRRRLAGEGWRPKLVHMVAPTIWAWGGWRKTAFEDVFDVLLCLFPFEPELFDENRLKAVFIGHPQADTPLDLNSTEARPYDLAVLPGSRRSEITHHLPVLLPVLARLQDTYGPLCAAIPALPHLHDHIAEQVASAGLEQVVSVQLVPARQILNRSAAMIAASGTVTLEAAISGVPGVVIYHLSPLNRLFTRLFYKKDTPVLPDLVLGRQHYPFLLPPRLSTDALYQHAADLLDNLPARQAEMQTASQQLCGLLRAGQGPFADNLADRLTPLI